MAYNSKFKDPRDMNHRSNNDQGSAVRGTNEHGASVSRIRNVLDGLLVAVKILQGSVAIWTGCLKGWTDGIVPA
jgi:hypothetical protein